MFLFDQTILIFPATYIDGLLLCFRDKLFNPVIVYNNILVICALLECYKNLKYKVCFCLKLETKDEI